MDQTMSGGATGYHASSSGCSSGIGTSASNGNRKTTQKRKQVRKCIAELRSLVDSPKGERTSTLNTLQHVLAHLKKVKEVGEEEVGEAGTWPYDAERLGGAIDGETPGRKNRFSVPLTDDFHDASEKFKFRIILGMKQHEVLDVSTELLDQLGYPKNYWYQQTITQFVYRKDLVTVASNLAFSAKTPDTTDEDEDKEKSVFFFRLRHYKSLRQGFSLNRTNRFSVFYAKASVREMALEAPPSSVAGLAPPPLPPPTGDRGKYIVLELKPMHSAYKGVDVAPENRSFAIRHTVNCNYNFVHPAAIALLGYLPQDMLGASVFDFYHPHDLSVLLGIYQEVVGRPGQTYKSLPYRMKTRNGSYVTVETEWSSFVNPWTHKLDFIIGQSEVILGPENPDVFMDSVSSKSRSNFNLEKQQVVLQKKIRSLLLQNVSEAYDKERDELLSNLPDIPSPTDTTTNTPITISFSSSKDSDGKSPREDYEDDPTEARGGTPMSQEEHKDDLVSDDESPAEHASSTCSSEINFTEAEKGLIYQRLNYAQNIRRFLMSCHSNSGSGTTVDSSEDNMMVKDCASSENATAETSTDFSVNMDITLAKPPSFASSTKAMISEHEQREEPAPDESEIEPPTPHNLSTTASLKDAPHAPATPATPATPTVEETYTPVTLTESLLKSHNKLQEQAYIKRMIVENRLVSTSSDNSGKDSGEESSKKLCKKRKTQGSESGAGLHKHFRGDSRSSKRREEPSDALPLHPPFNVTADASLRVAVTTNSGMPFTVSLPVLSTPSLMQQTTIQSGATHSMTLQNLPRTQQLYTFNNPVGSVAPNAMAATVQQATTLPAQVVQLPVTIAPPGQALQSIRWPVYHPQTGIPVMQSFIYQPVQQLVQQPFPQQPAHMFVPSTNSSSEMGQRQSEEPNDDSKNEESGSMGESSSGFMCLVDSSGMTSNTSEDAENSNEQSSSAGVGGVTRPLLSSTPPWLQGCQWNNAVKMEYTMPRRRAKAVLSENKVVLQRMKQSVEVVNQMQELMEEMEKCAGMDCLFEDEEADLLFWMPDERAGEAEKTNSSGSDPRKSKSLSSSPETVERGLDTDMPSGGMLEKLKGAKDFSSDSGGGGSSVTDSDSEASSALDKLDISAGLGAAGDAGGAPLVTGTQGEMPAEIDAQIKLIEEQKNINKNDEKMETGSEGSMDRCSKSSSCITPSDERSNEEAGSSLKESDNGSSDNGSSDSLKYRGDGVDSLSNDSTSSDGDAVDSAESSREDDAKEKRKNLKKLFVRLKIRHEEDTEREARRSRSFSAPSLPQWLMDIDFNERVQMQYVSPPHGRRDVLEEDKRRIEGMQQPQLVKEQMSELFAALGRQVGEALDVGALDVQYQSSNSSDVMMDSPTRSRSRNSEPMVEAGCSPRQGSPALYEVGDNMYMTQQSTSSGTEMVEVQKTVARKSGKGKGGIVKRSIRKGSSMVAERDSVRNGGEENNGGAKMSDADSGAEMQDAESEGRRRSAPTETPTSENSDHSVSEGIATMSSSNRSAGDAMAVTSNSPPQNRNDVNNAEEYDDDVRERQLQTSSELLGSLFTDDDQSNI